MATSLFFIRQNAQGPVPRQVLTQVGIRWDAEWQPYTLIGDASWDDYDVASDVLIETNGGWDFVMGRVGGVPGFSNPIPSGYWLSLNNAVGAWQLYAATNLVASGPATFPTNTWHNLRLAMRGSSLSCYVDNVFVTNVTDFTYVSGMAGIGCGWHAAQFDNFTIRALHTGALNLSLGAVASASSVWSLDYTADMANDGDFTTRWNTFYPTLSNEWLELDFPKPTTFDQTVCYQFDSRIFGYQIQHWNNSGWTNDFNGGTMGSLESDVFPSVTSSKVRLLLTNMVSAPSIYEFQVYGSVPTQPAVTINEWMTNNTRTIVDPANGRFEPWLELYNSGTTTVDLAGYYLAGTPANLYQFEIPEGFSIAPYGFLLVWADGLTNFNQSRPGDLHASFSLPQSSIISLLDASGQQLDAVPLGYQTADSSSGSRIDGDSVILPLMIPTPRQSNEMIFTLPPALTQPGGSIVLNYIGFPLATHSILSSTALPGALWSNIASVFSDGLGSFQYSESAGQSQRFYRAAYP